MAIQPLAINLDNLQEIAQPIPEEGGEIPEQIGFLPTPAGKQYALMLSEITAFVQKCGDCFSKSTPPKPEKNSADQLKEHAFNKVDIKRDQETQSQLNPQKGSSESDHNPLSRKGEGQTKSTTHNVDLAADKALKTHEQSNIHSTQKPADLPSIMQFSTQTKGTQAPPQNKPTPKQREQERKALHDKGLAKEGLDREATQKNGSNEERRKVERKEGFAEDEKQHRQGDDHDQEEDKKAVGAIEKTPFQTFATQDSSLLSEFLKMRVSNFDVLILFIEIMKLTIKGREQERIARMQERELQLEHMQSVVDNYKQQGDWALFTGLGTGVMGIAAGFIPIIGHMKGTEIMEGLSGFMSSLKDMDQKDFFKGVTKMISESSKMQHSVGEVQRLFSESRRTYDQHWSELYKTDVDESTRNMEEIKEAFTKMENFLHQMLQMQHETSQKVGQH